MPLTTNHPLSEVYLSAFSPSVGSGAINTFVTTPVRGRIKKISLTVNKAVATSTLLVSSYINNVEITGGGMTMTVAASTSGAASHTVPTAKNWVNEGDVIGFVPSVAAGTSVAATFSVIIKRG